MTELKIHQQIASLRKSRHMTQEDLAQALGVTNQTVSKWESAQCCPDIALLPRIAMLFGVTVDALLGCNPSLPDESDNVLQSAALLHLSALIRLSREHDPHMPLFQSASAKEHALSGSWGYSCLHAPSITTTMRGGTVFFSDNRLPTNADTSLRRLSALLKPFSDFNTLKAAASIFQLTAADEQSFATAPEIAKQANLSPEITLSILENALFPYLETSSQGFRIAGMYMNLLPLLTLLDFQ